MNTGLGERGRNRTYNLLIKNQQTKFAVFGDDLCRVKSHLLAADARASICKVAKPTSYTDSDGS